MGMRSIVPQVLIDIAWNEAETDIAAAQDSLDHARRFLGESSPPPVTSSNLWA